MPGRITNRSFDHGIGRPEIRDQTPIPTNEQDDFGLATIILGTPILAPDGTEVDLTEGDIDEAHAEWLRRFPEPICFTLLDWKRQADETVVRTSAKV